MRRKDSAVKYEVTFSRIGNAQRVYAIRDPGRFGGIYMMPNIRAVAEFTKKPIQDVRKACKEARDGGTGVLS